MPGQRHSLAATLGAGKGAGPGAGEGTGPAVGTGAGPGAGTGAGPATEPGTGLATGAGAAAAGRTDSAPDVVLLGPARQEHALARQIRARELVAGSEPAAIAVAIEAECGPVFGTTWIRAHRLALGIALTDVVAQVRAWYQAEGRRAPRFSETLLSAYESGHKRPGPEYLHYLCATYRADPQDLGYDGRCLCGRGHGPGRLAQTGPDLAQARSELAQVAVLTCEVATRPLQVPVRSLQVPGWPRRRAGQPLQAAGQPVGPPASCADPETDPGTDPETDPGTDPDVDPGAGQGRRPARTTRNGTRAPDSLARQSDDSPARQSDDSAADDDELRRMLLRLIADAGAGVDSRLLGAVDRIRRRMDEALLGATVSATMIDQWEETTAGYGRQYMTVPPQRLLCDALLDFGDVRRMCEERQPIEFSDRLCRLAGRLAGLAGMIMIDLGDQRLARSFFRTARTATDETGDRRLRAWVAAREALVPLYYGDAQEAATLAGTAADLAGRHTCVAAVMAPVVEARALARLAGRGRREALSRARAALDRAHDVLADLPEEDRGDTAFGYTERQLFFHEGDTLVTLGDCQGAERAFGQALRLYSPAEFLDCALVALGRARCLLEAAEPEQALRLSQETLLGLAREHRSELVVQAARALGKAAAALHADLPALAEYREALLTA